MSEGDRPSRQWIAGGLLGVVVVMASLVVGVGVVGLLREDAARDARVDGLPLLGVGAFVSARDARALPAGPFAVEGFWSVLSVMHGCAPPAGPVGVLEIRCRDGEFGITELQEPIATFDGQRIILALGPAMTPYVEDGAMQQLLFATLPDGSDRPPVRIVVAGHVGDPRAAACSPHALRICRDRFVIDRILLFQG